MMAPEFVRFMEWPWCRHHLGITIWQKDKHGKLQGTQGSMKAWPKFQKHASSSSRPSTGKTYLHSEPTSTTSKTVSATAPIEEKHLTPLTEGCLMRSMRTSLRSAQLALLAGTHGGIRLI